MFQRWGFLLSEIWVLLALAALLGLFVGWLIWSRRDDVTIHGREADSLRTALDNCTAKGSDQAARIAALEADLKAANAKAHDAHMAAENARADAKAAASAAPAEAMSAPASLMSAPVAHPKIAEAPVAKAEAKPAESASAMPKAEDKPKGLSKARDGKADDLKMIKGIGPKLEILCNKLGFFHFDQIADWTAKEIAWVDDNLEGFKGRVTRDEWVKQAKILAKGGTTEFANRVKDGDVY